MDARKDKQEKKYLLRMNPDAKETDVLTQYRDLHKWFTGTMDESGT